MIDVTPVSTENLSAVRELDTNSASASTNILSSPNPFSHHPRSHEIPISGLDSRKGGVSFGGEDLGVSRCIAGKGVTRIFGNPVARLTAFLDLYLDFSILEGIVNRFCGCWDSLAIL